MRVLVTGSSGFIGRSVVARLSDEPLTLRAVSHRYPDRLATTSIEHVRGDLRELAFADSITRNADVVIHLAGLAHVRATVNDYQEINVEAALELARAASRNGARRFIFASTVSVYGTHCDGAVTEDVECRPITEYGRSKLQAEHKLLELGNSSQMSILILRLSTAYGAGDPGNVLRLIRAVRKFGPIVIGDGTNRKSLMHVDSIAELMATLVRREVSGTDVVNVGEPAPYSLLEIVEAIADVTGDKRPVIRLPRGLAMAGAGLMELATGFVGRTPPIARDQIRTLTETVSLDVSRLRDVYGFTSQISLRDGIRRTLGLA